MRTCVRVPCPDLREKARALRRERDLTIDEIAARLALSRATVWSWVADLPRRSARPTTAQERARRRGANAVKRKHELLRETAYAPLDRRAFGEAHRALAPVPRRSGPVRVAGVLG